MQPRLDVALDAAPPATYERSARRRARQHQRKKTFPEGLITRALQQNTEADAHGHGCGDPPTNGGDELRSSGLAEVGQADCDDEKGFEPLAEGNTNDCSIDGSLGSLARK